MSQTTVFTVLSDPISAGRLSDAGPATGKVPLAAQRGECERAQVWGWSDEQDLTDVTVTFEDLTATSAAVLSKKHWTYKQQGYVNASTPIHYNCTKDILKHQDSVNPPPPDPNCDDTPWGDCWTGCPSVKKNFSDPRSCSAGEVDPIPKGSDGCNLCTCNVENTQALHKT